MHNSFVFYLDLKKKMKFTKLINIVSLSIIFLFYQNTSVFGQQKLNFTTPVSTRTTSSPAGTTNKTTTTTTRNTTTTIRCSLSDKVNDTSVFTGLSQKMFWLFA